jgi:hypothetical protein
MFPLYLLLVLTSINPPCSVMDLSVLVFTFVIMCHHMGFGIHKAVHPLTYSKLLCRVRHQEQALESCHPCIPFGPALHNMVCSDMRQMLVSLAFMLEAFVFTRYAYQLESVRSWFDHLWTKSLYPAERYVSVSQLGLDWCV